MGGVFYEGGYRLGSVFLFLFLRALWYGEKRLYNFPYAVP